MIDHLHAMIIVITYNFISMRTSFLCYYKLHLPKYILHILHGILQGPTFLSILNLNVLRDSDFFISLYTKSHIFGAR